MSFLAMVFRSGGIQVLSIHRISLLMSEHN